MKSKHLEGTSTITQFINTKASNIFYWLEWVVIGNHPFNFVENPLTRKGTKYESISVDSLMNKPRNGMIRNGFSSFDRNGFGDGIEI